MNASIDFSGVLSGSIADGGGGGGGDTVIINPVVTSGTKIADVSVNEVEKDLYAPNPTQVIVTPDQQSGTKIGSIEVNGTEVDLYAPIPTQVSVTQVQQSGTKIASIDVNGVNTDIFVPSGGVNYTTDEQVIGTWLGEPLYQRTFNGLSTYTNGDIWVNISGIDASTWKEAINVEIYCNSIDVNNKLTKITLGESRVFNGNVQVTTSVSYNREINIATIQYTKI